MYIVYNWRAGDNSDEGEHCRRRECDSTMYQCPNSGRCIPISWKCDGDIDCHGNGEDGKNYCNGQ